VLASALPFSPDLDESFFAGIPASSAVFQLRGEGEPYISKTANLRRRLQRLLRPPTGESKRLNLRERVRAVEFTCTGSDFESNWLLYQLLRESFPESYAKRLRLRPAALVKLHLDNPYPRASVTARLGRLFREDEGEGPASRKKNLYYGPFPSRAAAERFASDVLDFFKMRRCVDDLHPDPAFPGCIYSEMKMCLAPCFKGCTDDEYDAEVDRVRAFFDSGGESLTGELGQQRERASARLAFEEAAAIHGRIEKLKSALAQRPEIVRRIDRLDALLVQPSSQAGAVCLFRCRDASIAGPLLFLIDQRQEVQAPLTEGSEAALQQQRTSAPKAAPKPVPKAMESRVEEAIQSFPQPAPGSSAACNEQLAMLKRWYYRSNRIGEIFFADDQGGWPLRRIVRGIGRVYNGEKETLPRFATEVSPATPPQA
jgi:excinuclease ABC subunit C